MTACTTCGGQLVPAPPPPGALALVWGHATPPADGHAPGVPPLVVTYSEHGGWWDAECAEVPGFPVRGAQSRAEAKAVAWAILGKVTPPRPVIERDDAA